MRILIGIPIVIFYILFLLSFLGLVLCALYSRLELRHEITRTRSSHGGVANTSFLHARNNIKNNVIKWIKPILYGLCRYYSIIIGKIPSHHIRKFLLKHVFCMKIRKETVVYGGFEIRSPWNIQLEKCVVGVGALLDGRKGIIIHDDVTLAQNVSIFTLQHDVNDNMFRTNNKGGQVEIMNHAWVSSNTTILPQVTIGEGAVLASCAIATKDLEPFGIYAGVPAKKISERNRDLKYHNEGKNYWHFY